MKPKHPLAITFALALFIFCGVAFWLHSTNVITFYQDGIVDQTYPDWLMRLSTIVLCLGFLALLGLLFLPLDRSRHALPVWFRAHWFVPALFLAVSRVVYRNKRTGGKQQREYYNEDDG